MSVETDFPSNGNNSRDLSHQSPWVSVNCGHYRWDLQPLARSWLNVDGELPLSQWQKEHRVHIVKTGPHRTVYHLKLPEGNFYLKHYRTADWQAILQNVVRPSKADLEWQAAQKISQLGLPTFETVAIGRRKQFGLVRDNFLMSREIERGEPLDQFILQDYPQMTSLQQLAVRRDIARQLGKIAATLHRNGVLHRDFHPGNVLLKHQSTGCDLYLIDLHATSWKRRLSLQQIAENLSLLNNFFARLTSKTDRLRFLKSYNQVGHADRSPKAHLTPETVKYIGEVCQRELEKADRRGDKKWKRGNRRLVILKGPANHCRGLADLGKKQLRQLQERPEQLFEKPNLIAWQKREKNVQQGLVELSSKEQPQTAIVTAFAESDRAKQGWEMGHALVRRRLPAPRPLLFVETPANDWDYLVIEPIPAAVSLKHWLMESRRSTNQDDKQRPFRSVLKAVAVQLRRLHDHGFDQSELSLRSFLIQDEGSSTKIWFASLETLQQLHRVDRSQIHRALATLLWSIRGECPIGLTDRLRFLRVYLNADFRREWKSHWRGVARLIVKFFQQEAA